MVIANRYEEEKDAKKEGQRGRDGKEDMDERFGNDEEEKERKRRMKM